MIKKVILALIVLLIVGMTIPATRARILEAISPVTNNLKTRIANGQLDVLADQVDMHYQRTGRFPGTAAPLASWLKNDFSGKALDPWGNEWFLRPTSRTFTVGSMGPDGEMETADDITEERRLPR